MLHSIYLARHFGAELRIITVSEPLPVYTALIDHEIPGARQKLVEEQKAFYADLQEEGVRQAAAVGVKADAVVIEGQEVEAIVDQITAFHADLLVIGRRRHSAMSGLWGRTVHSIAEKTCCSILAVC